MVSGVNRERFLTQHSSSNARSYSGILFAISIPAAMIAGAIGLSVQIVCTRIAVHSFGSSSTIISAMIAMALLGLSLGSWTIGRIADSVKSPLRTLGFSFLLCAIFIELVALFGNDIAAGIYNLIGATTGGLYGDRGQQIAFALATMLPINFLLGGVLPLLTKIVFSASCKQRVVFDRFGVLYAAETIGAAAGALAAAFWSIQFLGLQLTLHLSALFVGVAGCLALVAGMIPVVPPAKTTPENVSSNAIGGVLPRTSLLIVVALAGSASLGMEVIWQRLLTILFGSDTHSLAIVAATFLIGIAVGALISPIAIRRLPNLIWTYGLIVMAIGFSAICVTNLLLRVISDHPMGWIGPWYLQQPVIARFATSFGLLLVPTMLIGAGFPIAVHLWIQDYSRSGRHTGQIYGIALLGNVLGVLGCGYLLIPTFGLRMGMLILSGFCLAGGLAILWMSLRTLDPQAPVYRASKLWVGLTVLCLLAGWGWVAYTTISHAAAIGVSTNHDRWTVDYYHEGPVNTVAVVRDNENQNIRKMIIDGIAIGESGGDVDEKQQMLAHLPMLLRPGIADQNVLTIGLGTGILAGELAGNPAVSRLTCVELSPSVIEAAETFSDLNGGLFSNEKVRFVQADGIQYLLRNDVHFDAIVSDAKSRPGHAGNVAFFSRDYYALCESRLTENGMFVQWVSLTSSTASLGTIMRTFADAFPDGHLAIAAPGSIYLVGSKQPVKFSESHITQYLQQDYSQSLTRYHWNSFDDLLSMYWLDQKSMGPFVQHDFQINTLDVPVMESFSLDGQRHTPEEIEKQNLDWLLSMIADDRVGTNQAARPSVVHQQMRSDPDLALKLQNARIAAQEIIAGEVRIFKSGAGWLDQAASHYKAALNLLPDLTRQRRIADFYRQLAENARRANRTAQEFSALATISELKTSSVSDELRLAQILNEFGKPELALEYFYRATKMAPDNPDARIEFGFGLLSLGKIAQAEPQFRRVIALQSEHALAHLGLGIVLEQLGEAVESARHLNRALEIQPELRERLDGFRRVINETK